MEHSKEKDTEVTNHVKMRVLCGANEHMLEDMIGQTPGGIRRLMREVLNIGDGHTIVLVNGKSAADNYLLDGNEEVEFQKPAGTKGV